MSDWTAEDEIVFACSTTDLDDALHPDEPWTHADVRSFFDQLSDHVADWQGIPVLLGEDNPVVLADGHPLQEFYRSLQPQPEEDTAAIEAEFGRVINGWYSHRRNADVYVMEKDGRRHALVLPVSPDKSMDRLTLWLQTMGAADAWNVDAEYRARDTLRVMLSERQYMHYDLTGSFFETSPRSRLTYVFRRLRPTIALSPRGKDGKESTMRCIAVLCMHSVAYYSRSWAGAMVPSDDVIAALTMMRADEAYYWRHANQHKPSAPEAGI